MRRLFIIRKDLQLSPGKLAAMVGHCAEAYWTKIIRENAKKTNLSDLNDVDTYDYESNITIEKDIFEQYINRIFTKTICEARNLKHLVKAEILAKELGLKENSDFGWIRDRCLTELIPENEDGTTTVGIWFKPLNDE